ncbi:hypothetical protein I3843_16G049500 [Carya illinoinensis]|nr:hypothetical protein I3843_16G049500 [Carya illinoinensis]
MSMLEKSVAAFKSRIGPFLPSYQNYFPKIPVEAEACKEHSTPLAEMVGTGYKVAGKSMQKISWLSTFTWRVMEEAQVGLLIE